MSNSISISHSAFNAGVVNEVTRPAQRKEDIPETQYRAALALDSAAFSKELVKPVAQSSLQKTRKSKLHFRDSLWEAIGEHYTGTDDEEDEEEQEDLHPAPGQREEAEPENEELLPEPSSFFTAWKDALA
jgi:hypothetical protein